MLSTVALVGMPVPGERSVLPEVALWPAQTRLLWPVRELVSIQRPTPDIVEPVEMSAKAENSASPANADVRREGLIARVSASTLASTV